jgi:murein DD-endopeptidase MepM/ murein hydrolase activator NlpD
MVAVLAAGCVLASFVALPLANADGLKHKKHAVEKKIHATKADLDENSAAFRHAAAALDVAKQNLRTARGTLATTRAQLAAAQLLDEQMQARLNDAVAQLDAARTALTDGRAKVTEQEQTLRTLVVETYQDGNPALMGLSMVFTTQDPTQLTGQLNSVSNVMDKQAAVLQRLQAAKVLLVVQAREVAQAKDQVAQRRAEAAANLLRRQDLERQAAAAAAAVQATVKARSVARARAHRAALADQRMLKRLQRQEHRIGDLLRRRAAARHAGRHWTGDTGGVLAWPVRGPVTSPFGWRIHPIFGYRSFHDGIDIAAACGTPIHAPASGRVLQEYYQTAWGNRIILDFGVLHHVGVGAILNHLSGYAVHTGAHVRRGQVIGYIGTTGWSTGCHTHFTVMVNGTAVNPMNWL